MNLFLDCEFNSMNGSLLSVGIITDSGKEWYAEIPLSTREPWDGWVKDNVLPQMETFHGSVPQESRDWWLQTHQKSLEEWLAQFESLHVIVDWPDDVKYFCEFLITGPGERIDTPPLTFEIRRDIDSTASEVLHHALHDARAIRTAYCRVLMRHESNAVIEAGTTAYLNGLGISDNPYVTGETVPKEALLWHHGYLNAKEEHDHV